ncbi:hypothetical protein PROFUN_11066 [Planoprotostelium fungivorum]|uniref:F-box domain-containing protein n=1 Tax=Planoprotostelium fungivorum TaxID=1890364 RepID=A0A2P6NBP0_9EUKA|nr:hypothetical protein PROFUN_11066 [Planoprotostelium fungivorum]
MGANQFRGGLLSPKEHRRSSSGSSGSRKSSPSLPQRKLRNSSRASPNRSNSFSSVFPHEVFMKMLSFLDAEDLCRVGRVSNLFHLLSQDTTLWYDLLLKDYSHRLNYVTQEERDKRMTSWQASPLTSYIRERRRFFDINLKSPDYLAIYVIDHPEFNMVLTDTINSEESGSDIERASFRRLRQTWSTNIAESVKRNFDFVREAYHNIVLWKTLSDKVKELVPQQSGVRYECVLDDDGELILDITNRLDEKTMEHILNQLKENVELLTFLGGPKFNVRRIQS